MLFERTTVIANAVHEMVHPRGHAWMMMMVMAARRLHYAFVLHDERLSLPHATLAPTTAKSARHQEKHKIIGSVSTHKTVLANRFLSLLFSSIAGPSALERLFQCNAPQNNLDLSEKWLKRPNGRPLFLHARRCASFKSCGGGTTGFGGTGGCFRRKLRDEGA
jgi:hypothetical protein